MNTEHLISSEEELREFYDQPMEGSLLKQKETLTDLARDFIAESPFLCLATSNPDGSADCSPKGDPPGFVKVLDEKTIAIPDRKGNNRLDSLVNILHDPKVGILFLIPQRHETLRVNGIASISKDPELMKSMAVKGKEPKVAVVVDIKEVYFHCPKALIRSKLWKGEIVDEDLVSYSKIRGDVFDIQMSDEQATEEAKKYRASLKDTLY